MIEVLAIDTPSLGNRSYLATDGMVALVVDPPRDIDRVLVAAADRGVAVAHVLETHIHHDYLSGGLALATETGAAYHVNGADEVAFARSAIGDGDVIQAGAMRVRALATPGHTWTHLSYVLEDRETGEVVAVFTGGSLLNGSAGRPDLLGARHARSLAAAQRASARWLAVALPGHTPVYPTHGLGSPCAAGPPARATSTIGDEKRANAALTLGEDRRYLGITVLDVRRPREWAASHIDGALHIPLHGLPGRLADLPPEPVWVHCQSGYRASIAASLLSAAGHPVTLIDDDYGAAAAAGLRLTGEVVLGFPDPFGSWPPGERPPGERPSGERPPRERPPRERVPASGGAQPSATEARSAAWA